LIRFSFRLVEPYGESKAFPDWFAANGQSGNPKLRDGSSKWFKSPGFPKV
jgi:hypothetical protein